MSKIGAKVFASMSTFAAPSWNDDEQGVFLAEDERRKAALVAAVEATATGWSDEERTRAAAALDVLWTAPSYQRLVTGWKLDADEAADVIDWMIILVVDAIRTGQRRRRRPRQSPAVPDAPEDPAACLTVRIRGTVLPRS